MAGAALDYGSVAWALDYLLPVKWADATQALFQR
jgi:hypothetical protein